MKCDSIRRLALPISLIALTIVVGGRATLAQEPNEPARDQAALDWQKLPDLPDPLGVAGPFVGVHNGALIIAGGANFPQPVWKTNKVWHDAIHVLTRTGDQYRWHGGGVLPRPIAYGAAVSTPDGIVCMGGNDGSDTFAEVFLLRWDPQNQQVSISDYPPLPKPCAYGQAVVVGDVIYLAGGQSEGTLDSAMRNFWRWISPRKTHQVSSPGGNSKRGRANRGLSI